MTLSALKGSGREIDVSLHRPGLDFERPFCINPNMPKFRVSLEIRSFVGGSDGTSGTSPLAGYALGRIMFEYVFVGFIHIIILL